MTKVITDGWGMPGTSRDQVYRLDRNGKLFIAHREAICLGAYPDGEHMSIGMGDNDRLLKPGDTITVKQAFDRFNKAIASREKLLSARIKREPTQEQYNALFSCFYQSGWKAVPYLLEMHNAGEDADKVGIAFARAAYCTNQAGHFIPGLQKRRLLEGRLYGRGEYEPDLDVVELYDGNPHDKTTTRTQYRVTQEDLA